MTRKSFQPQFVPLILAGSKIHTIRATPKRLPKIGEEFVGFIWTGKPYRSPQREFFKSTVKTVGVIEFFSVGMLLFQKRELSWTECCELAQSDGFSSPSEMSIWFLRHHALPFTGILIEWAQPITPLRALRVSVVNSSSAAEVPR